MSRIKLATWDIEGTLILAEALKTKEADMVVRGNCLQLIREPPKLNLIEGVEPVMRYLQAQNVHQGIASSYAYQFANNYLAACSARDYIDPRIVILANKFAWEGHVLDGKDWDETLRIYAKPSPKMLDIARGKLEEILGQSISETECMHIGDQKHDEEAAKNAGWNFLHIEDIAKIREII